MFCEKVIELLKEAERNPETIDQYNVRGYKTPSYSFTWKILHWVY